MVDLVDALHGGVEASTRPEVAAGDLDIQARECRRAALSAVQAAHSRPLVQQKPDEVGSDEAVAAGDEDSHAASSIAVGRRIGPSGLRRARASHPY